MKHSILAGTLAGLIGLASTPLFCAYAQSPAPSARKPSLSQSHATPQPPWYLRQAGSLDTTVSEQEADQDSEGEEGKTEAEEQKLYSYPAAKASPKATPSPSPASLFLDELFGIGSKELGFDFPKFKDSYDCYRVFTYAKITPSDTAINALIDEANTDLKLPIFFLIFFGGRGQFVERSESKAKEAADKREMYQKLRQNCIISLRKLYFSLDHYFKRPDIKKSIGDWVALGFSDRKSDQEMWKRTNKDFQDACKKYGLNK